MENNTKKSTKNDLIAIIVCFIMAAVFIGVSVSLFMKSNYVETTATIVSVDKRLDASDDIDDYDYYAKVIYTVDGKDYIANDIKVHDMAQPNETTTIRYNPANPEEVTEYGIFTAIITAVIGAILAIITIALTISTVKSKKLAKNDDAKLSDSLNLQ